MEKSIGKTEKAVLMMVYDLLGAGHAEELQCIIVSAITEKFQNHHKDKNKEMKDKLQNVTDIIEGRFTTTTIDNVTYPMDPQEEDSIKVELIGNILSETAPI